MAFQALQSYAVSWNSQLSLELAGFAVDDLATFLESSADFGIGTISWANLPTELNHNDFKAHFYRTIRNGGNLDFFGGECAFLRVLGSRKT